MKRVVITGAGAISPLGHDWPSVYAALQSTKNAIQVMPDWCEYEGLNTQVGAPAQAFTLPRNFNRKTMRSMGRVAVLATLASQKALEQAQLLDTPLLSSGQMGVAYGSSSGCPTDLGDFSRMMQEKSTHGITANTYVRMMSHTAAVNIGVFFGLTGRIITTSSACTSGSQGIGYAYEMIQNGKQIAMLAGGAEELNPAQAAVFDTLFATSTAHNEQPAHTPRPFDSQRDGLVLGEGACTLVLEELEHAQARGAPILAEIIGYGTNSDGSHVTHPNRQTMAQAMQLALEEAKLPPSAIGYINAHGTATQQGDMAESQATQDIFGENIPISSLKSYMGHTLGACGALEAWISIEMMRAGWFAPTLNLDEPDPQCGVLDYITGTGRLLQAQHVMSNNFAFGGINTSLIFQRWSP